LGDDQLAIPILWIQPPTSHPNNSENGKNKLGVSILFEPDAQKILQEKLGRRKILHENEGSNWSRNRVEVDDKALFSEWERDDVEGGSESPNR